MIDWNGACDLIDVEGKRLDLPGANRARKKTFFSASFAKVGVSCELTALTSAPAEKNLPSPVRTVKMVSGCLSNSLNAAITSTIRFPPKELSCFGLFNCE